VRIITALRATGDVHVADRLVRCMAVRRSRHQGDGWPWTCRSPGCLWCGKALARRWWRGIKHWIRQDDGPVSLAILPLSRRSDTLRVAVARLRRACRDIRDRTARRRPRWRGVVIAGMATGDDRVLLLVRHAGIDRAEISDVLGRRWPTGRIGDFAAVSPLWTLTTEDAVELARARRGVESLRIVVPCQRRHRQNGCHERHSSPMEPMPVII
jgi:hypothetical protein